MNSFESDQGNLSYNAALGADEPVHAKGLPKETEHWLHEAMDNASDMITVLDANVTIRYVSPASERILGYRPEELVGAFAFDYIHPEDVEFVSSSFAESLKSPGVLPPIEFRLRRSDGSWRQVEVIRNNQLHNPAVRGMVTTSRDITRRKRTEEEIRFQAKLLDAVGQAVIATDSLGKITYWNGAAEKLYGWSADEVIGGFIMEVTPSEEMVERAEEIMQELAAGRSWSGEFVVRRKDGTSFPMLVTDTPVHDEQGNLVGIIGVSTDVTEIKKTEALRRSEEYFRSLIHNSSDIVTILEADGTVRYVSPTIERMLGHRPQERKGRSGFELIHPEDLPRARSTFTGALRSPGITLWIELRMRHRDGSWRHVEVTGTNLLDDKAVRGIVLNWRDITERVQAEEALRESEERYRSLVELSPDAVLVHSEGRIVYANPAGEKLLGAASSDEIIGKAALDIIHPDHREIVRERVHLVLTQEKKVDPIEERIVRLDGRVMDAEVSGSFIFYQGKPSVQNVIRDITERKAFEEQLQYQAFHDVLTDLPNRRLFVDRLEQALKRTRRLRESRKVAVLFMDMDDFKIVNDSLGHEVGDELLVAVAERLKGCLRSEDTLARFGGDEFTVLVEDVEGPADAVRVAGRIGEALREPFVVAGQELFTRPSIGISLGGAHTTSSPAQILRDADTAMYRAKKEGSGYRVFEPVMYEQALSRLKLENELQRAIESEEFVVHYQPILDLRTGQTWGIEALVRWRHPERGLLNPMEFVPSAEESGLVIPMGEMVLKEACKQAKEWRERYPHVPPWVMSVNLSARQVGHPDLARTVERVLREAGLEARWLSLDITKTAYVEALEGNADTLDILKRLGVCLSIDDFGTGYSSLAYLKRLPADTLKIDRSFIKGLGEEVEDRSIIKMVVDLAHAFGMEVVAEGVESEWQAEQLKEMGCDHGQGYHFARPLPAEVVPKFSDL